MPPGPAVRRVLAAACLIAVAACSEDGTEDAAPHAPRIADLRGQTVLPARAEFCDRIPADVVAEAVGDLTGARHHDDGETARLAPGVRDVAHEFACEFRGRDGSVAEAWVFVPPVTRDRARGLARSLADEPGCAPLDAGGFGRPSTGRLCTEDGRRTASYHGLFGGAWFSCSLRDPRAQAGDLRRAAEGWCVEALRAAASPL